MATLSFSTLEGPEQLDSNSIHHRQLPDPGHWAECPPFSDFLESYLLFAVLRRAYYSGNYVQIIGSSLIVDVFEVKWQYYQEGYM